MEPVKSIQKSSTKRKYPNRTKRYAAEFKLQVVKKYLEESIPASVIHQECGVSSESIGRWVRVYRREGEAGLSLSHPRKGRSLPSPVRRKIVELKRANPLFASDAAVAFLKECPLLTDKKMIYCCNVDEPALQADNDHVRAVRAHAQSRQCEVVKICAKMEEDLNGLADNERQEFLHGYNVTESGLDQIVRTGYRTLGLISYLTAGPKEVRAWTIRNGWRAPQAAGVIHTDFERGFIRAQVISYKDYVEQGGEAACRAKGLLRVEGKEYVVQDGDVIEFLFNV